jgi:hypothetical protein
MSFYWEWSIYNLPSGKTVDDVKNLVATNPDWGLPSLGYTGIKVGSDVHGEKGSIFVAVTYLPTSGSDYWQVVSCVGDKADLSSVVGNLGILHADYF